MAHIGSALCGTYDGRTFCIGDSISTYEGYSNDALRNSTIGWNAVYYPKTVLSSVNDTWWMRTISKAGANLLVNNSWSADKVLSKGLYRATQLHDDTGEKAGTKPDIIVVYLGINDYHAGVSVEKFERYYKRMIASISKNYPDADIFLMNYIPNNIGGRSPEDMLAYNQVVANTATKFDCTVVDLYEYFGEVLSQEKAKVTVADHMHDDIAVHPNKLGMAVMSEILTNTMNNKYAK